MKRWYILGNHQSSPLVPIIYLITFNKIGIPGCLFKCDKIYTWPIQNPQLYLMQNNRYISIKLGM